MSERTVDFLYSLIGHQAQLPLLLLLVALFVAIKTTGKVRDQSTNSRTAKAATVGRVLLVGLFGLNTLAFAAAILHVACARTKSQQAICSSNLRQIGLGLRTYVQDYDERMPPAADWEMAVGSASGHISANDLKSILKCPAARSSASYAMNEAMGLVKDADVIVPAATVMLFEADAPHASFAGSVRDLVFTRHSGMGNIAFIDGHVKMVRETTKDLVWSPQAAAKPN